MKKSPAGKTAIITGGGGGIGRAIAEKLARELSQTGKIVEQYSDCLILPGDLTSREFRENAVKKAICAFGAADVLINNAGVAQHTPFEQVSEEEFDRIMTINNKVPFFLTRMLLPFLKQSEWATIINIASVVAHAGYPMQSVYAASKHALLGWTKALARECYQDNIRVHAVSPGGVYTDMVKLSRPDLTPEGMILPEEIAEIVWFFLANRGNAVVDEISVHRLNKEPFI